MVIVAALFSQQSVVGEPIYVGPTIMTFLLFAGWWIGNFAAIALAICGFRSLFRRAGWRVVWAAWWRAALLKAASMACVFVFNTWVFRL